MEGRRDYLDDFMDRPFRQPPKSELVTENLQRLIHPYWNRDTLIELPHRTTFDQLNHVWNQEQEAITQSSNIHVMDAMNLLATNHVHCELTKLE